MIKENDKNKYPGDIPNTGDLKLRLANRREFGSFFYMKKKYQNQSIELYARTFNRI